MESSLGRTIRPLVVVALCAVNAGGCDESTPDPTDAGVTDAGGIMTDAGPPFSIDEAIDLGAAADTPCFVPVGDDDPGDCDEMDAAIAVPGEVDVYRFTADEGQAIRVHVQPAGGGPASGHNPVATLYNASTEQVAFSDDPYPGYGHAGTDLITVLPTSGTYYIAVEDQAGSGDESYLYALALYPLEVTPENGSEPASPDAEWISMLGEDDVDVFQYTTPGLPFQSILDIAVYPAGPSGTGSTTAPTRVSITDTSGTVLAQQEMDFGNWVQLSVLADPETTFLLRVEGGRPPGANGFVVLESFSGFLIPDFFGRSFIEEADVSGDRTGASVLDVGEPGDEDRGITIRTQLPEGDVDYFQVQQAGAGERLYVDCMADAIGSGVTGLTVVVEDASGTELFRGVEAMDVQQSPTDLRAPSVSADLEGLTEGARYFVRLSNPQPVADFNVDTAFCDVGFYTPES